jgi:hypothetical protein
MQIILASREFKFVWKKGQALIKGEIITKMQIYGAGSFKNLVLKN